MSLCVGFINRKVAPVFRSIVRNAGGGGRPGAKPAFNWKEKKILGISSDKNKKDFKLRPYGNLDDIKDFFQTDDVVSPFDGKDKSFDQADLADAIVPESSRKVINVASLYGSKKTAGLILKRKKPENRPSFSIGLIFGERHRKIAEEKRLKSAAEAEKNTVRQ